MTEIKLERLLNEQDNPVGDYSLKVKIEASHNKFNIMTSHNGNQWSGGTPLTLLEIVKVRDELNTFITEQINQ